METPGAFEALRFGWRRLGSFAPGFFALLAGWVGVWVLVEVLVIGSGSMPGRPIWLLLHASYFLGTSFFEAAILDRALATYDGREARPRRVLRDLGLALRFTAFKLVLLPAAILGLALLLVPGLVILGRFGLGAFVLVDRSEGLGPSLEETADLVRGRVGGLTWIVFVVLGVNLLGACLLGVGLLATLPVTCLAVTAVYRGLGPAERRPAG